MKAVSPSVPTVKPMTRFYRLNLPIIAAAYLSACGGGGAEIPGEEIENQTLWELAQSNPELSTFVEAAPLFNIDLKYLNAKSVFYDASKKYTVFAPTNAAFAAFFASINLPGLGSVNTPAEEAILERFLLCHLVEGDKRASFFNAEGSGYLSTLALENLSASPNPNPISMFFNGEGSSIMLNGNVQIIQSKGATNGVLHVVDKGKLPSVADFIHADPQLASFKEALAILDVNGVTYDGIGDPLGTPYTIFAPEQKAFVLYQDGTPLAGFDPNTLRNVIETHIAQQGADPMYFPGSNIIILNQFADGYVITPLSGEDLTVEAPAIASAAVTLIGPFLGAPNQGKIIQPNIQAANGVIHIVDQVILPA